MVSTIYFISAVNFTSSTKMETNTSTPIISIMPFMDKVDLRWIPWGTSKNTKNYLDLLSPKRHIDARYDSIHSVRLVLLSSCLSLMISLIWSILSKGLALFWQQYENSIELGAAERFAINTCISRYRFSVNELYRQRT